MNFLGLCGSGQAKRPCVLTWSSGFGSKASAYPSDLLPSNFYAWYLNVTGSYSFGQASNAPGTNYGGIGGGIVGGIISTGAFTQQPLDLSPVSTLVLIFAKTNTNLNTSYTVTQTDIDSASKNEGIADIVLDQYVFEILGVTDQKIEEITPDTLSPEILAEIKASNDTVPDYIFRELMKNGVGTDLNRLIQVITNFEAIDYRLDNSTPLSAQLFGTGGVGKITTGSYRDAASKTIRIDLTGLEAGSVIYIHYVGISKHYFRQVVRAKFSLSAVSNPPECAAWSVLVQAVNYKFFTWKIDTVIDNKPATKEISGWRAVEAFNVPTWMVKWDLSNKLYSSAIYNRDSTFTHPNTQTDTLPLTNVNFSPQTVDALNDHNAQEHVYFNVSPEALKKPDIYKMGIEASLAREIQKRISDATLRFPFFDDTRRSTRPVAEWDTTGDPSVKTLSWDGISTYIDPVSYSFLSSSNFQINPVKQMGVWSTANSDVSCGVSGGLVLGQSPEDVATSYVIGSPYIQEDLDAGTSILVESAYTYGQTGLTTLSIEATKYTAKNISCIEDPMGAYTTEVHSNSDGLLCFNVFNNGLLKESFSVSSCKTDLLPPATNIDPIPQNYFPLLGYSGLLGDMPGYFQGRIASTSNSVALTDFIYCYTDDSVLHYVPVGATTQKMPQVSYADNKITLTFPDGMCGIVYLFFDNYKSSLQQVDITARLDLLATDQYASDEYLVKFKEGTTVNYVIDDLFFSSGSPDRICISTPWIKANTLQIEGQSVASIAQGGFHAILIQIKQERFHDFLQETTTSTAQDKPNKNVPFNNNRGIVFQASSLAVGEDSKSNIYVFFVDQRGNISVARSPDFGNTWYYAFAVIPRINDEANDLHYNCSSLFLVNSYRKNSCFLFYLLSGKLFCRTVHFDQFAFEDMMLVPPEGDLSLYSLGGKQLRQTIAYLVAGKIYKDNTVDSEHVIDNGFNKLLTLKDSSGAKVYPYAVSGQYTTTDDLTGDDYSAYINNRGLIRVLYVRQRSSVSYLFWKTSNDDQGWASAQTDENIQGKPIHDGKTINCFYTFYKPSTDEVLLFYGFDNALFCKVIPEPQFEQDSDLNLLDPKIPCYFVDGIINNDLQKSFANKLIRPPINYTPSIVSNFESRAIPNQRVCAQEFANGYIRVFYQNSNNQLRSAVFMGSTWQIDDFMRSYKS